ncbi:hypothetical protein TYRP_010750 [Tyrophagus putrescentiae]|nr:hypothetical protein TYRP_010750 [Tyrophagus putrescentiae]
MNRVSTLIVFSIVFCSVLWPQCEGEKGKRNLFIIGGNDGCGPAVVYKTSGGKKGKEGSQIIIVNSGNCGGGGGGGGGLQFMPYPIVNQFSHRETVPSNRRKIFLGKKCQTIVLSSVSGLKYPQ